MNQNQINKGISLIVLIITIIIIIILAGAIILGLSDNNPIESANRARFLSDVSNYKAEISLYIMNKYVKNLGVYDPLNDPDLNIMFGDKINEIASNKLISSGSTYKYKIQTIIHSMPDKDAEVFGISGTQLLIDPNIADKNKIEWLQQDATKVDFPPKSFTPVASNITKNTFNIKAETTDDFGIANYSYYINNELKITTNAITYEVKDLIENTEYKVYVIATDTSGRKTKSTEISITTLGKKLYLIKDGQYTDITGGKKISYYYSDNALYKGESITTYPDRINVDATTYGMPCYSSLNKINLKGYQKLCIDHIITKTYGGFEQYGSSSTWLRNSNSNFLDDPGIVASINCKNTNNRHICETDISSVNTMSLYISAVAHRCNSDIFNVWLE